MLYYTCKQEILYMLCLEVLKCYFAILLAVLLSSTFLHPLALIFPRTGLMLVVSLVMRTGLTLLTTLTMLSTMPMTQSTVAILILRASWTLIFGLCEGVLLLKKITITVDDATLDRLRAMRELNGVPFSVAIRFAVLSYYQDKFVVPPAQKK